MASPDHGGRFGKYRIVCHLKSGGMGSVYKAVDPDTGRTVALKVLSSEAARDAKRRERFRREAHHGARLMHENIVGIYDFGEANGTCYLVLEFVEGIDLDEYIREHGTIDPAEARDFAVQIARGLDYAHSLAIVHRDIKPANILLARRGDSYVAKLGDLGLVRALQEDEWRVTSDGATVGTVDYMAPEQARDSGSADIRSDLYALGCTIYHMLTGQPPFASGNLIERVVKHSKAEPADARKLNPAIPDGLWAVCKRLLAKKPADRYQTPGELIADLAGLDIPAAPKRQREDEASRPTVLGAAGDAAQETSVSLPRAVAPGDEPSFPSSAERIAAGQFASGMQAVEAGNYDYGLMLLLNACRLDPANLTYRQGLRQGQVARASTPDLRPWRWRPIHRVQQLAVKVAARLRWHDRVLRWGEDALCSDPHDADVQVALAAAAEGLGHTDLAIWVLEEARLDHPTSVLVNRALAVLVESRGDFRQATRLWELVARQEPDNGEARRKITEMSARDTTRTYYNERKAAKAKRGDARS